MHLSGGPQIVKETQRQGPATRTLITFQKRSNTYLFVKDIIFEVLTIRIENLMAMALV